LHKIEACLQQYFYQDLKSLNHFYDVT
jgi:hypothetical protein